MIPLVNNPILLERLQKRLGYTFQNSSILQQALTHRSFGANNNERLEFLGDSLLGMFIGERLYEKFTNATEGELTRIRSSLVKGETLAQIAREFELGDCLIMGEGELKSGGFRRDSILADAVESIIAGIYLESGFETSRKVVLNWFGSRLDSLELAQTGKDPKTQLQEYLQACGAPLPKYGIETLEGEAHNQVITVSCEIQGFSQPFTASAKNKKQAEKKAAQLALNAIKAEKNG
ncbi:ribonuclease III [Sessilibacter corallicola]|uniref:ribonuclease III n=1 Tax=Sessilibacter corallicola TaxID=2904075 RepID=UPI003D9C6A57